MEKVKAKNKVNAMVVPVQNRAVTETKKIAVCAMFVAIGVILGGVLNIPGFTAGIYSIKIGFGTLFCILAGILYGPIYGGMVGALTDLVQALLFPKGDFQPWFTVVGIFFGLIPGLFFIKRNLNAKFWYVLLAVTAGQIVGSVILNTILISTLYGMPWQTLIVPRIINQAIMIPLYTVIIFFMMKLLREQPVLRKVIE